MPSTAHKPIELQVGAVKATVAPSRGGKLTSLDVAGRPLILEQPQEFTSIPHLMSGCFLMAPWVGRLRRAELAWRGVTRFPANLGDHAIHGLVASNVWEITEASETSVEMQLALAASGWPFGGSVTEAYTLEADGLHMSAAIEAHERGFPAALGWHPWFRLTEATFLAVDADRVLELDNDKLPTGRTLPVDERTDLRAGGLANGRCLDDVYVDPRPPAVLEFPNLKIEIRWGERVNSVVVFVTDYAVCVEPQTAWPDAPNLYDRYGPESGLVVLEPHERLEAWEEWRWSIRRPGRETGTYQE